MDELREEIPVSDLRRKAMARAAVVQAEEAARWPQHFQNLGGSEAWL